MCKTWGPASRFQPTAGSSSRTADNPLGSCLRENEIKGNLHAKHVSVLCHALVLNKGYYSIENPLGSYLFLHPGIMSLSQTRGSFFCCFDQCLFGLQLPGCDADHYIRKRTRILTNVDELTDLEGLCAGPSADHKHEHCWGSRIVDGKHISLTSSAATYPIKLCRRWAKCIQKLYKRLDPP